MKGLFLAIEGGDGAGKSSQLALLAEFFKKRRRKIAAVHFPRLTEKPYGEMISAFLRGDYGPLETVDPHLAALLYALDRHQAAPILKAILDAGDMVLADRYILSNIAYQCAKLDSPDDRRALADWIETLEYGTNAIPRPDLTLYLDVPLSFSLAKLAKNRGGMDRAYLKGKQDIHESSSVLQRRVREEYLTLAKSRPGEIGIVDCGDSDGGMADRATIHSRIVDALRYYDIA